MKTDKEKELPQRKHPRLYNYDYSSAGAYFVTICAQNRRCVLSRIVWRGLAPAEAGGMEYTTFGKIAEQQILLLEDRYAYLSVDQYVIMPNHIHAVLISENYKFRFIEQKAPADLEKSAGVIYCLLRSKSALYKLTYL